MANKTTTIKAVFKAETQEFSDGIKKSSQDITSLTNQLKTNATQLKGNADNVKLLEDRHKLLESELKANQDKQSALTSKLEVAKKMYGENSDEVYALKNQLEKAKNQEAGIQNEITATNQKLEEQKKATNNSETGFKSLTETISDQKKELQDIKNRYEQVVSEQGKNSEEALALKSDYNKLSQEIKDNERAVNDLNGELGDTGGFSVYKGALADLVSTGIQRCIDGLKDLSKEVVDIGATFESSMSRVRATSGATEEQMKSLEDRAKELGKTTRYTSSQVGDAFYYMSLAGWDTQEMLDGISGILSLTTAGGMDLANASDIVTDNLSAFGLTAKDTNGFVDQLSYAMSHSNTDVEQLGEAYKNVAAVSTQFGYSLEDTTSALMVMADSGIKGGESGTALASIMTRLGNDVSSCRGLLEHYGVEVYDSQGKVKSLSSILQGMQGVWGELTDEQKSNLSYVVAGKTAQAELMTVLGDSTGSFAEYKNGLEDCNGSASEMASIMEDNLQGDITLMSSAFEGLGLYIYDKFEEPLKSAVDFITNNLIPAIQWCIDNFPMLAGIIGALTTAILINKVATEGATIAMTAHELITKASTIATNGLATIQGVLNGIMNMNPISKIIIGITILVVAIKLLWDNCEWFRNGVMAIFEAIKTGFSNVIIFFQGLWATISAFFTSSVQWISENVINPTLQFFQNLWDGIKNVWNGICNVVSVAVQLLGSIFNLLIDIILIPWNFIWVNFGDTIMSALTTARDFIVGIITNVVNWIMEKFNIVYTFVSGIFTNIYNFISTILTNVWTFISNIFMQIYTTIHDKITQIYQSVQSVFEGIKNFISNSITTAKNTAINIFNALKDGISDRINNIKDKVTNVFNAVKTAITSPIEKARDTVKGIVDKIKGFFHFKVELPNIKLPHFAMTPSDWKIGDLLKGSVPKLGIDWYAKAMDDGIIMNKPTAFGINTNGEIMAGGEAGSETIVGTNSLLGMIKSSIDDRFNNVSSNNYDNRLNDIYDKLEEIADKGVNTYLNGRKVSEETGATDDRVSGTRSTLSERGLALA